MTSKRISLLIICLVCVCLLAGCGSSTDSESAPNPGKPLSFEGSEEKIPLDAASISFVIKAEELPLLDSLTELESADFTGSDCIEEIYNWAQAHPQVDVKYSVTMPDGSVMDTSAKSLDLSEADGEELRLWAEKLMYLPNLKSIELGSEREGLGWEDIHVLHDACPDTKLKFYFELYGKQFDLQNTQLNLRHQDVLDNGEALRQVIDLMPNLTYIDMDSCGVPNEEMAKLRDDYPHIKIVWRVWFGGERAYSARTDAEMILASKPSVGGFVDEVNGADLKYCTEVKYLDLGHNATMRDISFVQYMPKLEVLIIAMAKWKDATPLTYCKNLEYLEMQTTNCTDLSPLAELKNLRHLNICCIRGLEDISPLYELTELERLWLGSMNAVPAEQVEAMQKAAPNCEINTTVYDDPTSGGWRYGYHPEGYIVAAPRYILLRLQFNDYKDSAFSFNWNDPLYYEYN